MSDIKDNKSGDKILNNAYNRGDIEYDAYKEIKIESDYLANNLGDNYSSEDYHRKMKLDETLYNILSGSEKWKIFLEKKALKSNLGDLYNFLITEFQEHKEYTKCEFFYSTIDLLDVSYESLYNSLYIIHKSQILEELNKEKNIFMKKKFNPLF